MLKAHSESRETAPAFAVRQRVTESHLAQSGPSFCADVTHWWVSRTLTASVISLTSMPEHE